MNQWLEDYIPTYRDTSNKIKKKRRIKGFFLFRAFCALLIKLNNERTTRANNSGKPRDLLVLLTLISVVSSFHTTY